MGQLNSHSVARKTLQVQLIIPSNYLLIEFIFDIFNCYSFSGNLTFMNFLGDWGNSPEGCGLEVITGECELTGGPSGPAGKGDNDFPYPTLMK